MQKTVRLASLEEGNDFDYYADYESLKVTYYDENGYGHHMEIEE